MPRIAARTEPYADPTRQQRHFKTKRDQALRALGKASYVNGSHFAILFVSAKGTPESYGTPLFQDKLNFWFNATVTSEAIQLVRNASKRANGSDTQSPTKRNRDDDRGAQSTTTSPVSNPRDECSSSSSSPPALNATPSAYPFPAISLPNPSFEAPVVSDAQYRRVEPPFTPTTSPQQPRRPIRSAEQDQSSDPSDQRYLDIFSRIQQHTCKIICKSWIKVIEPKKQTRFPYQGEDQTKPDWWPKEIRHKEPDHLVTAERQGVMLAILKRVIYRKAADDRTSSASSLSVAKLELNTAEVMVHIPPEKHDLLKELYQTAKEDEKKWLTGSVQELPSRPPASGTWERTPEQDVNKNVHSYLPTPKSASASHIPRSTQDDENLGAFTFYEDRRSETNAIATPRTAGPYEARIPQYPTQDRSSNRFHPYYTNPPAPYLSSGATRGDFISAPSLIPPPVHQDSSQPNYTYSSISHSANPFNPTPPGDYDDDEHEYPDEEGDGDFGSYVTPAGGLSDTSVQSSTFTGLPSAPTVDAPISTGPTMAYNNVVYQGHWMLPTNGGELSLRPSQHGATEAAGSRGEIVDNRLSNGNDDRPSFHLPSSATVSQPAASAQSSHLMTHHHQLGPDSTAPETYFSATPTAQSYQFSHQHHQSHQSHHALSTITTQMPMQPSPSQASASLTPRSSASSLSADFASGAASQLPVNGGSHSHYTPHHSVDSSYSSAGSVATIPTTASRPTLRLQATHDVNRERGLIPVNVPSSASHQQGNAGFNNWQSSSWPINESV